MRILVQHDPDVFRKIVMKWVCQKHHILKFGLIHKHSQQFSNYNPHLRRHHAGAHRRRRIDTGQYRVRRLGEARTAPIVVLKPGSLLDQLPQVARHGDGLRDGSRCRGLVHVRSRSTSNGHRDSVQRRRLPANFRKKGLRLDVLADAFVTLEQHPQLSVLHIAVVVLAGRTRRLQLLPFADATPTDVVLAVEFRRGVRFQQQPAAHGTAETLPQVRQQPVQIGKGATSRARSVRSARICPTWATTTTTLEHQPGRRNVQTDRIHRRPRRFPAIASSASSVVVFVVVAAIL